MVPTVENYSIDESFLNLGEFHEREVEPLARELRERVLRWVGTSEHYGPTESRRRHFIDRELLPLVSAALGDRTAVSGCAASALYVDRLPTAPSFADEQAYFQYLGAAVPTLAGVAATSSPQLLDLAGDKVLFLKIGEHVERVAKAENVVSVRGRSWVLCQVARGQRVILSTDTQWSYLVLAKSLINSDTVEVAACWPCMTACNTEPSTSPVKRNRTPPLLTASIRS